jgi:hypothetical protein
MLTLYLRLERVIRDLVSVKDYQRVHDILEQLCNDYAYAVHQPHARNGGLIGLAAAAIALGPVRFNIQHLSVSILDTLAEEIQYLSLPQESTSNLQTRNYRDISPRLSPLS